MSEEELAAPPPRPKSHTVHIYYKAKKSENESLMCGEVTTKLVKHNDLYGQSTSTDKALIGQRSSSLAMCKSLKLYIYLLYTKVRQIH